jgi:two-component system LytT family response regulator
MNILICDDDKLYIDMIRKYVDEFFADHKITDYKVYEYNSGDEAAKNNEKIDIAFLDVEMNGINGIEASTILRKNNKDIIVFIITSYMGYLDDAMDEGVFRYINKPIEKITIFRGLQKAVDLCYKKQSRKIVIESANANIIIEQDSILYIESLLRKRHIYTESGEYISTESLTYWKNILGKETFCHVNKSTIINIKKVKEFSNTYVKLENVEGTIDIARDRRNEFKQKLLMYLAGQE